MFCTTSETEGEVRPVKLAEACITDLSNAVVLLWFSVASFWCHSFGDVLPYVCSY